ncbi:MAG: regulatory protein [Patescibacteria group bacterium]|nr:regulatory protein [Patescibacteria group bacterium]
MIISSITPQTRNKNRVNISVDGVYRFSLDVYQLVDLNIKIGRECNEAELVALEQESEFGKAYSRALEYCLMRPHSVGEIKDYLYRKTKSTRNKKGEIKAGLSSEITVRILARLTEKGYVSDEKFARYWVENRSLTKGSSRRKLISELRSKGVSSIIIEQVLKDTERDDSQEIQKIILKKRQRYSDEKKLIAYLARLGFDYDTIKQALSKEL